VAQGALGIEACDDRDLRERLGFLHDVQTYAEVSAERAFADRLGSGCHVPIGARARALGDALNMIAVVAGVDGRRLCRGEIAGHVAKAAELGGSLADRLIHEGADQLLTAFKK
jgi:hydroxymethylbilane synthase